MFKRIIKIISLQKSLKKVIRFVKYHNAFTISLILVFIASASVFAASPTARDAVIGKKIVEQNGIDNSYLLTADLDNFDFKMQINSVSEDSQNYYLDYNYQTLAVVQNVWQDVNKQGALTVSKDALAGGDLGLYAAEELGEIIDSQLAYLQEVQEIEQSKGQTFAQETTDYTALAGLILNPKTRELPGYELVVKPPPPPEPIVYKKTEISSISAEPLQGEESVSDEQKKQSDVSSSLITRETGIIIYDRETGEPYCVFMQNGQLATVSGACSSVNTASDIPDTIIDSTPEPTADSADALFNFHATITGASFQCQVNNQGFAPCESPKQYSGLTDGSYTFEVYAVNSLGQSDESPASFEWTVDTETVSGSNDQIPITNDQSNPNDQMTNEQTDSSTDNSSTTEPIITPDEDSSTTTDTATTTDDIATSTDS